MSTYGNTGCTATAFKAPRNYSNGRLITRRFILQECKVIYSLLTDAAQTEENTQNKTCKMAFIQSPNKYPLVI